MDPVLFALLLFLIFGSVVALQLKDLLSAVIAAGVVGLGLSIVFLLLGAPDIAITQVVVEVLVVTVLIRATTGTERVEPGGPRPARAGLALGVVALVAVVGFVVVGFMALPEFGAVGPRPSDWYLAEAQGRTGAANVVTAILLDFRAYDTLGEATVILASIVGVLAILRRPARRRAPSVEPPSPPAPGPPEGVEAAGSEHLDTPEPVEVGHA